MHTFFIYLLLTWRECMFTRKKNVNGDLHLANAPLPFFVGTSWLTGPITQIVSYPEKEGTK